MGFNGSNKNNLRRYKDGSHSNSTGSLRISADKKQAWSYRETLFVYDEKLQCYVVNVTRFSNTTSRHLSDLWSFFDYPKNAICVDVNTLNNYESLKKIKLNKIPHDCDLKLFTKKQLKDAKNNQDAELKRQKERMKNNRIDKILTGKLSASGETWLKHYKSVKAKNDHYRLTVGRSVLSESILIYLIENAPMVLDEIGLGNSELILKLKNESALFKGLNENEK
jgi:hypothetical protein